MVLNVNGVKHEITVDPDVELLIVLRNHLDLTGSKYGCGEGACGACTVLINGKPSRSCMTHVGSVVGKEVTTIEGLEKNYSHYIWGIFVLPSACSKPGYQPRCRKSAKGNRLDYYKPGSTHLFIITYE